MSDGINQVFLLGNLGADPELRWTAAGTGVLHLRLATNESWTDKEGKRQEVTSWHTVTVFGKRGEALSKILKKGTPIFVEGRIRYSSYEKDGVKRYSSEIVSENIKLVGERTGPAERNGGSVRAPAAAAAAVTDDLPF